MSNREFLRLQIAAMKGTWFQAKVQKILGLVRKPTHLEIATVWRDEGHAERFRKHFKPFLRETA